MAAFPGTSGSVPAGRANPGSGLKVGRQHRGKNKTALLTVISAFFSLKIKDLRAPREAPSPSEELVF